MTQYARLQQDEDSSGQRGNRQTSGSTTRWLIVVGFGSIGVFYVSMSVRSAGRMGAVQRYLPTSYLPTGSFAREESDTLRDENRRLKQALAAAEEAARRRDAEATAKMAAFAEAAAKPGARPTSDNDFMKGLMSGLSATVEDPAAAASAAAAKAEAWMQAATAVVAPTLQQTLQSALGQSPPPPLPLASGAGTRTGKVNPADYKLTKELIKAHCDRNNVILVTFVNSKRADYAYTWAAHLQSSLV
jgi:hypothetical protein